MSTDPGTPAGGGAVPGTPESSRTADRLQSMLAQAVEGQQSEQRELTNALTDIRNQLMRVGQELGELRAARPHPGTDPALINNITVEVRESVRFLSERLDGVTRMVAQRGEELADIRSALTAVDDRVRSQTETIGVLSQGLQALPSYGERVSALHEAVNAINSRLAGIEATVAKTGDNSALVRRLADIESAVGPLAEHVAASRQATADHGAALDQQAESMAAQRASLEQLHDRIAAIADGTQAALAVPPVFDASTIEGIEAKLADLADDVAALSGGTAVLDAEERLRAHIDDAVLALAEILVRRRPGAAEQQSVVADPEPVGVAPLGLPADDEVDADTPVVDFSAAEFGDEDDDELGPEIDDEYDEDDSEYDDYEEHDDYDVDDETDVDDELAAESAADDDLDAVGEPRESSPPQSPSPWSPEVPPERPGAEPATDTVVPDEPKRRWFSR